MPKKPTIYRPWLTELYNRRRLDPFAWHFAETVARLAPDGVNTMPDILFLFAVLTAQNTIHHKHVCLDLAQPIQPAKLLSIDPTAEEMSDDAFNLPLPDDCLTQLRSDACAFAVATDINSNNFKPLVLEDNRLYLHRYWVYENLLSAELNKRHSSPATTPPLADTIAAYTRLQLDQEQIEAIRQALSNRLCVITGGPGTGKTTIISVVINALLQADPTLNIRLCAPTGKAQARLKEALQAEINQNLTLGANHPLRTTLNALATTTIHRLLKHNPNIGQFTYNQRNRLTADVLIVDEVSMVSLALLVKLLTAMPDACRIILFGDKDQLAAVESGAALADLHDAWHDKNSIITVLTQSHRFRADSGIGRLKDAINSGANNAWDILKQNDGSLRQAAAPSDFINGEKALTTYLQNHAFCAYQHAPGVPQAFEIFDSFRILCATRHGPCGVDAANRHLQKILAIKTYEHGYPVIINVNDYTHRLFNGDVGICLDIEKTGIVRVWFPDYEKPGAYRSFSVIELPEHSPVFAMTIHKAQGSGFNEILLILPTADSPVLTRELLYTGLTRAKTKCTVWSDRSSFETAVARPTMRMSGLVKKLTISPPPET